MSETPERQQKRQRKHTEKEDFSSDPFASPAHNRHFLRYLRENATLTQTGLAEAIKVEPETVRDWETGRRHPSQKHLLALEKFFRLPSGGLSLEMKDILAQDFSAAYFGDAAARQRLEWIETHRDMAAALGLLPISRKTQTD